MILEEKIDRLRFWVREILPRNWKGGAYTNDQTGEFSHCAAGASYQSGIYFVVTEGNVVHQGKELEKLSTIYSTPCEARVQFLFAVGDFALPKFRHHEFHQVAGIARKTLGNFQAGVRRAV